MLAILTDSKLVISTLRKLDKGLAPPRPEIEARNSARELATRMLAWRGSKATRESKATEKPIRYAESLKLLPLGTSPKGWSHRRGEGKG